MAIICETRDRAAKDSETDLCGVFDVKLSKSWQEGSIYCHRGKQGALLALLESCAGLVVLALITVSHDDHETLHVAQYVCSGSESATLTVALWAVHTLSRTSFTPAFAIIQ